MSPMDLWHVVSGREHPTDTGFSSGANDDFIFDYDNRSVSASSGYTLLAMLHLANRLCDSTHLKVVYQKKASETLVLPSFIINIRRKIRTANQIKLFLYFILKINRESLPCPG